MRAGRWMTGLGLGALCAAAALVAPALQAQEGPRAESGAAHRAASPHGPRGTFTPAAADPKLAAILARSGVSERDFQFTPSEARRGSGRAVTIAVRARSTRAARSAQTQVATAQPSSLSLAPIAYNLGVSVGWKRFAVSGNLTHVDLVDQPGSRDRADLGVSYTGKRASGRIQANADRPLVNTPVPIGDSPSYSIDVGGSYSLTRNLELTAGVRYKSERDRLPKLADDRRDSQAVYVGTAFRF